MYQHVLSVKVERKENTNIPNTPSYFPIHTLAHILHWNIDT